MSEVKDVFSKLSHGLKNDFVLIRAALGGVRKHASPSEIIEEKIVVINNALDQAIARLDVVHSLLLSLGSNNTRA